MEDEAWSHDFLQKFLDSFHGADRFRIENLLRESTAQLLQDLFVLNFHNFKRSGYFVEVGAADGFELSNTRLLERFGWTGILSEPAKIWHDALLENREGAIDKRAVWSESGELMRFHETQNPTLSQLANVGLDDLHKANRSPKSTYTVSTVSLLDLLDERDAPEYIDFLSLDTEGSELQILEAFDFDRYSFGVVCVEHNYTAAKNGLRRLMSRNDYMRVDWIDTLFDDWFFKKPD